jgi:hypothetical protein
VLEAGDLLYIPGYWFHHVISETDNLSLNFWMKCAKPDPAKVAKPFRGSHRVALARNIERAIAEFTGAEGMDRFARQRFGNLLPY